MDAQQWAGMFYRVEIAEAPACAANMNADSDGDGSSTLLEFALGTDPRVNSRDGIGIYTDEDGYLTLTTNRNPAASGLRFRIAVSGDLATWHSDAAHVTTITNTSTLLKARDNVPLGNAGRRFIWLEVNRP